MTSSNGSDSDGGKSFSEAFAELLLSRGANPNLKNHQGNSPLHGAVVRTDAHMTRVLLRGGAHVDPRNNRGDTPLALAVASSNGANIEELLARGADMRDESVARAVRGHGDAVAEEVKRHWVKLGAADMPVDDEWKVIDVVAAHVAFYEDCLEEVDGLKSSFVDGDLSLHQWLKLGCNERCGEWLDNKTLKRLVESSTLDKKFPKYADVVRGRYREAVARKALMQPAKEIWYGLMKSHLSNECVDRIFNDMSNADLVDLIEHDEDLSTPADSQTEDNSGQSHPMFLFLNALRLSNEQN